jgi:hypothetical protein
MASKFARQMQRKEKRVLNVSNHRIATLDVPKMTQVTLELTHKTIASTRLQETTNVFLVHDAFTIRIHCALDQEHVILCRDLVTGRTPSSLAALRKRTARC